MIKYTESGGWIEISIEGKKRHAIISIKDSGVGIPDEDFGRVSDCFYQIDKSRKGGSDKGVGLGLSIAHQIILTPDGELTANSEMDKESCFVVKIPLRHEKSK